uniref:Odorant receptor n=1 Tax=Rhodnius prolixus TaxID=13249 RepID=T1HDM9_RHOPR
MQRIRSLLQHYDRYSDEVAEKFLMDEFYHLLKFSLFYPNLKSPLAAGIHLLQFIIYVVVLSFHIAIFTVTIIKAEPSEFLISINTAHFGFIMLLFLTFIFMSNRVRYKICFFAKMLGEGVFTYEDEEEIDEEVKVKQKYLSILKKLKIILPSMNIVAGFFVVVIGPWIDSKHSPDNLTQTDSGINIALPIPSWYPFETNCGMNFYIAFLGQFLSACVIIVILASASCSYFTCTLYNIIQLERLIISVQNLEKRAILLYKKKVPHAAVNQLEKDILYEKVEFIKCLEYCLRQNIKHHQLILRLNRLVNILARGSVLAIFLCRRFLGMSALEVTV